MINIELIETLRKEHCYSQEVFAKMLGYESRTAYNTKIKGKREFSITDIVKICKIFDLELADVIMM